MARKYHGWVFKNKQGFFIVWTLRRTQEETKKAVSDWRAWKKLGFKLVKIKLIEVK